jgi:hypothetical protein
MTTIKGSTNNEGLFTPINPHEENRYIDGTSGGYCG